MSGRRVSHHPVNGNRSQLLIARIACLLSLLLLTSPLFGAGQHKRWKVSVTISPTSTTLQTGMTQQFKVSVTGTTNTAVTWLVNGVIGGNATVGTVSAGGLYTAPAAVPAGSVTVTAQSVAATTQSASAAVTVTAGAAPASPISVAINPTSTTLTCGQSQQFSASVTGTTNTGVSWLVNGVAGGNTTVGTISAGGLYTAPASVPASSVTVTARSVANTSDTANATVTVTAAPATVSVTVSPTSTSLSGGQSQQFSAAVSGATNTSVVWQVNGTTGGNSTVGTISTSGLYTAPVVSSNTSVTVTARSYYDSTAYANANVNVAASSSGPALYVSTTGSDSNSCTSTAPCATISRASQLAIPGTTIHVAAGTYYGDFVTSVSGTASQPITYVSDTKWGAKLVGTSSGRVWTLNASYVVIDGFDISGPNDMGIYIGWTGSGFGHNTIQHNRIHDLTQSGGCNSTGGSAIETGEGEAGYNKILANVVANIGASMTGSCNTIQGIYIATTNDVVQDNLVSGIAEGGIQQWHGATNSTIVNNTVFNCNEGIILGDGDGFALSGGSSNNYVANNIVVNNKTAGIDEMGTMSGGNEYIDNLLYNNPKNLITKTNPAVSGTVNADPLFVNYQANGTGNYHLQSGSPAINAGTPTNAPTTNLEGTAWTGAPDIGAY